jgi:hypothetical protein
MLISMFRSLNRILREMLGIAKAIEKIQDNQEHGVELISILSEKQSSVSKPVLLIFLLLILINQIILIVYGFG